MTIYKISHQDYSDYVLSLKSKKLFIFCDVNTAIWSFKFIEEVKINAIDYSYYEFSDHELIPTLEDCEKLIENAKVFDYIIAIGSGSLNDMGKYVASSLELPYGIIASAPSMDGYASVGSALMNQGVKTTYPVKMPNDLIVDLEILKNAPSEMIASGFGDIIGKYTSLADWKLAQIIQDESINQEAFEMMEKALNDTIDAYDLILSRADIGIDLLMNALITAGTSMAICGNSRPASGSEHHVSHYLEMEFVKQKKTVPLHGFKVALGTMIILDLYNMINRNNLDSIKKEQLIDLVKDLPTSEKIKDLLKRIGAPIRFREIGVSRQLLKETLINAYLVRDRFTILTWMSNDNDYKNYCDLLVDKYY